MWACAGLVHIFDNGGGRVGNEAVGIISSCMFFLMLMTFITRPLRQGVIPVTKSRYLDWPAVLLHLDRTYAEISIYTCVLGDNLSQAIPGGFEVTFGEVS